VNCRRPLPPATNRSELTLWCYYDALAVNTYRIRFTLLQRVWVSHCGKSDSPSTAVALLVPVAIRRTFSEPFRFFRFCRSRESLAEQCLQTDIHRAFSIPQHLPLSRKKQQVRYGSPFHRCSTFPRDRDAAISCDDPPSLLKQGEMLRPFHLSILQGTLRPSSPRNHGRLGKKQTCME
jgi:hypothetical protein